MKKVTKVLAGISSEISVDIHSKISSEIPLEHPSEITFFKYLPIIS